jgi:hypothetical protein
MIVITGPMVSSGAQAPHYSYLMREVITELPAGEYWVYTAPVRQGRVLYTPHPATTLITVAGGTTTRLTVPFSGSGPVCPIYVCGPRG